MIEAKPEVAKQVEAILEAAAGLRRGDTLEHRAIQRASGVLRNTARWNHLIRRVRVAFLKRRRIALQPVAGVGYRLCLPTEQVNGRGTYRQRKALRQLRWGIAEVGAVPAEDLSEHDRRVQFLRLVHMKGHRDALRSQIKEQERQRQTEAPPIRPRNDAG